MLVPCGLAVVPLSQDQTGRPIQPTEPFSAEELRACVRALQPEIAGLRDGHVVVMTYLTDVPQQWLLGRSAAIHGLPLVLVGHGMRWDGPAQKLSSARRAAQLLQALAPNVAIVFADGLDAMVVNPLSKRTRLVAERVGADGRSVLVGAECNSWCVTPCSSAWRMLHHAAHQWQASVLP